MNVLKRDFYERCVRKGAGNRRERGSEIHKESGMERDINRVGRDGKRECAKGRMECQKERKEQYKKEEKNFNLNKLLFFQFLA